MPDEFNPAYYKQGDIEAIEAIEAMLTNSPNDAFVDYCRAQIMHYLWRLGMKNDVRVEAGKARWYINRLVDYLDNNDQASHAEHDERTDFSKPSPIVVAPTVPSPASVPLCQSEPSPHCGGACLETSDGTCRGA